MCKQLTENLTERSKDYQAVEDSDGETGTLAEGDRGGRVSSRVRQVSEVKRKMKSTSFVTD
jgi:hypothetical protein